MTRRAFTLFEVLVTIAMLLALVGTMGAFLHDLLRTRVRLLELAAAQRSAATLIERLETDLAACLVGEQAHGAGVAGDESSLRVLTRAVPVSLAERGAADSRVFADLELTEFRFDAASGLTELRRTVVRSGDDAAASDDDAAASDDDAAASDEGFEPLGGPLGRVRFRFHDESGWRNDFDSLAEDRLPRAVEIAVWYDAAAEEAATEDVPAEEAVPDRIRIVLIPDSQAEGGGDDVQESAP